MAAPKIKYNQALVKLDAAITRLRRRGGGNVLFSFWRTVKKTIRQFSNFR